MAAAAPTETRVFTLDPHQLAPQRETLEQALGYRGRSVPEAVSLLLDDLLASVPPLLQPSCAFCVPPGRLTTTASSIVCSAVEFHTEPIITKRLRKSTAVALFVATIGPRLERWSKELTSSDMLRAFVLDAIASVMVEAVAEWVESAVASEAATRGWRVTNRYSPGYCGWTVADQPKLFSFFPKRVCGISLTSSCLMVPIKSVSGIIGLGPDVKREEYECSLCDLADCFRRREGPARP